ETQRLARGAFEFTPLPLASQAPAHPRLVYVVGRPLPRPAKARGIEGLRAELVGRDEELCKLQRALTAVLEGQGRIVSLIGEAGVGKSRLVAELRAGVGGREHPLCGYPGA